VGIGRAVRQIGTVLHKDLVVELRTKEILLTMSMFAVLVVIIFSFAFYTNEERARVFAPGILWVTVVFAGSIGLGRLFERERESGALDALLLSPLSARSLYLAKFAGNLLFTVVMELLAVPLVLIFFSLDVDRPGLFVAAMLLGTIGYCSVGTLFAAALSGARLRELLLPLVVYPLVVPVVIAGVKATAEILAGAPDRAVLSWIQFMVGFDLLFGFLSMWLFGKLVGEGH
jgi:heme exporter protein CcmB